MFYSHIWDLRTNSSVLNLDPADPYMEPVEGCFIEPMEADGKFGIFLFKGSNVFVYEVDLSQNPVSWPFNS